MEFFSRIRLERAFALNLEDTPTRTRTGSYVQLHSVKGRGPDARRGDGVHRVRMHRTWSSPVHHSSVVLRMLMLPRLIFGRQRTKTQKLSLAFQFVLDLSNSFRTAFAIRVVAFPAHVQVVHVQNVSVAILHCAPVVRKLGWTTR